MVTKALYLIIITVNFEPYKEIKEADELRLKLNIRSV